MMYQKARGEIVDTASEPGGGGKGTRVSLSYYSHDVSESSRRNSRYCK